MNGDGALDVVVANSGSDDLSLLLGSGSGTGFTFQPERRVPLATGSAPQGVALADLDGNKALDVVVAESGSGKVAVLLGLGNATFQAPIERAVGSSITSSPQRLALADYDLDGLLDVAVSLENDAAISVLRGDGKGALAPALSLATGVSVFGVVTADFDADGRLDLAAASNGSPFVSVYYNRSSR